MADLRKLRKIDLIKQIKSYEKLIKKNCVECCGGNKLEARLCVEIDCPMLPMAKVLFK
jgi:hypothetical protein